MQTHFDRLFNSVIPALKQNIGLRTFSHYEVRYFSNWYLRQTQEVKDDVKDLIKGGNFEFIGGVWEGEFDSVCPHYSDIILNIQRGHRWLSEEFEFFPRAAWNLDPFGHSDAAARLYAESGIEAMFIRHVDPQDRENRMRN